VQIVVTGGAGFIGSAVINRLLGDGHHVVGIDNLSSGSLFNLAEARHRMERDFTFHQLDVRSPEVLELVQRRQPEMVVHLAGGHAVSGAVADADVNIVGTVNVLEAAVAAGVKKVVVASTGSAVYGEPAQVPITESHGRRPLSTHGVAKHAADAYLAAYRQRHGLEYTCLVLASVYGWSPCGVGGGLIAEWARRVATGQPCMIEGDGQLTRDYVFIDDAVDAIIRAVKAGDGLVLNIGTGVETSLESL
jgi:UDP-glucose 4-epimerase